jgi:beta-lactamase regulating signal transducer with metallopeptidase domain
VNWHIFFLDLALRGLIISSVAAVAVWKLRGRKRIVTASFALCVLLILPAAQMLPRWQVTMPDLATAVEKVTSLSASWKIPVAIWSVGFLLIAARLLPGWITLQKWKRKSARATKMRLLAEARDAALTLDLHPVPEVRVTSWRTMPAACGFWHGTVFLPEDALQWSPEQLRMVLLHELAHLKRRDPGMQALGHLACALHWFNPFVWMLHRTWMREREMACDALVLSTGVAPRGYAMHLVDIAEKFRSLLRQPLPSAAMAGPGLEQRVRTILQYVPRPRGKRRGFAVGVLLSACALVTAAATFLPAPYTPLPATPEEVEVQTRLSADPFPAEP